MDGLAVDGFPEGSTFVISEGVKERFAEGRFLVQVMIRCGTRRRIAARMVVAVVMMSLSARMF